MLKIINFCIDFCGTKLYNNNVLNKGGDNLGTKMGRPTDNPKGTSVHVRLDKKCTDILKLYCEQKKTSKAEAIRKGIILLGYTIK